MEGVFFNHKMGLFKAYNTKTGMVAYGNTDHLAVQQLRLLEKQAKEQA